VLFFVKPFGLLCYLEDESLSELTPLLGLNVKYKGKLKRFTTVQQSRLIFLRVNYEAKKKFCDLNTN
jgi:hypothetical protein